MLGCGCASLLHALQEDVALHVAVARASRRAVQMVRIAPRQSALELWEAVCGDREVSDPDLPLLLLPEEYALLDPQAVPEELAELLLVRIATSQLFLLVCPSTTMAGNFYLQMPA